MNSVLITEKGEERPLVYSRMPSAAVEKLSFWSHHCKGWIR